MDSDPSKRLAAAIDQVIAFFNAKKMDLPDGFFDRKTQFVLNGAPFETLLGQSPTDPLILMLARGPAGFRFTAKALQHALPDARIERSDLVTEGDPFKITTQLCLSGTLRDTREAVNTLVAVTLRLNVAGSVERAESQLDEPVLEKIRRARRS
jgi:hypothetical protein